MVQPGLGLRPSKPVARVQIPPAAPQDCFEMRPFDRALAPLLSSSDDNYLFSELLVRNNHHVSIRRLYFRDGQRHLNDFSPLSLDFYICPNVDRFVADQRNASKEVSYPNIFHRDK